MDGSSETTKPLRYPSIAVKKNERVSLLIGDIVNSKNPPRRFSEKLQARPICRLGSVSAFVGEYIGFTVMLSANVLRSGPSTKITPSSGLHKIHVKTTQSKTACMRKIPARQFCLWGLFAVQKVVIS